VLLEIRCDLHGNPALFESGFGQDAIGFNEDCTKRLIIFRTKEAKRPPLLRNLSAT
jgi:hypothetical protein